MDFNKKCLFLLEELLDCESKDIEFLFQELDNFDTDMGIFSKIKTKEFQDINDLIEELYVSVFTREVSENLLTKLGRRGIDLYLVPHIDGCNSEFTIIQNDGDGEIATYSDINQFRDYLKFLEREFIIH